MKVTGVDWRPFAIPFRGEYSTARGRARTREGLVIRLHSEAGLTGLGEASLPPEAPARTAELVGAVRQIAARLIGGEMEEVGASLSGPTPADRAIAAGLDIAAGDALARARGCGVASALHGYVRQLVTVNATIAAEGLDAAVAAAVGARVQGFGTVKLKVGMAKSVAAERRRVEAVRETVGPHVHLRLDANGAWDVGMAIATIQALAGLDIELVEQPVPPHDIDGLRSVQDAVDVIVAADEAVVDLDTAVRIAETGAARALVLKPLRLGGLRPARRVADVAAKAGLAVIVTTTIDTGIATAAALHLAATLPPDTPACGLATASLLVCDLTTPALTPVQGVMRLPDGPGLGVDLDEAALDRFAAGDWERAR